MAASAYSPQHLRQVVAERAKFRCEYRQLQQELCPDTFEVDHIIPRVPGGKAEPRGTASSREGRPDGAYFVLVIFDPWMPRPAIRPFWLKMNA
jgi:hypothetical protein